MNLCAKKMPPGIHNGRCQGPNPAALIRLLPQSGELGISHEARMETMSLPLNRLAETWKTMSLSSNGKRHHLQANSGREPSPSTASMKRHLQQFKSRFSCSWSTYKLRELQLRRPRSVFQPKSSLVPFSVQGKVKPTVPSSTATSLPSAWPHLAQSWWKGCGPKGSQTIGQGCRAWLAPISSASEGTRKSKSNPLAQQGSKRPILYC